jgi:iron-sulfur cluster assembly protein
MNVTPPVDSSALLTLTPAAGERLREVAAREGVDPSSTYLRVLVVAGGCSGLTHDLGWDSVAGADDEVLEAEGLRILLDRQSAAYLDGSTLDFSEGLDGRGFYFDNPQAARTCACGESFSL